MTCLRPSWSTHTGRSIVLRHWQRIALRVLALQQLSHCLEFKVGQIYRLFMEECHGDGSHWQQGFRRLVGQTRHIQGLGQAVYSLPNRLLPAPTVSG